MHNGSPAGTNAFLAWIQKATLLVLCLQVISSFFHAIRKTTYENEWDSAGTWCSKETLPNPTAYLGTPEHSYSSLQTESKYVACFRLADNGQHGFINMFCAGDVWYDMRYESFPYAWLAPDFLGSWSTSTEIGLGMVLPHTCPPSAFSQSVYFLPCMLYIIMIFKGAC